MDSLCHEGRSSTVGVARGCRVQAQTFVRAIPSHAIYQVPALVWLESAPTPHDSDPCAVGDRVRERAGESSFNEQ